MTAQAKMMAPAEQEGTNLPAIDQIRERGYAVLEGLFGPDDVAFFRDEIAKAYAAIGSPKTFARPPLEPAKGVEISVVGLVFHRLGVHVPSIAPKVLAPAVLDVARGVLGDDMHLEYTCAVVNADDRPFFKWHAHIGGVDNERYRKNSIFPRFEQSERLTMLLYLDDLTDETGTLLVHPRRIEDPTEPPYDPLLENWEGQVEMRCRKGTVVLMDQCTWHAARGKHTPGLRVFVACYFTSSRAAKTSWTDDSLSQWATENALLAAVLPRSTAASHES